MTQESEDRTRLPPLRAALERMLGCAMPDAMRREAEALLLRPDATERELKAACDRYAKRLVLARPRAEIPWHPTVDGALCVGCGECHAFCPHEVYDMRGGAAVVARPDACVILCSNCMPRCPAGAIAFPPQTSFVELMRYA